jgi:hypothetical protein
MRTVGWVVILLVLLVVKNTWGECAWILWEKHEHHYFSYNQYQMSWSDPVARNSYEACLELQKKMWEANVKIVEKCVIPTGCAYRKIDKVPHNYIGVQWNEPGAKGLHEITLNCLPDTIDPRK